MPEYGSFLEYAKARFQSWTFDNPDNTDQRMTGMPIGFKNGDYQLDERQMRSVEAYGQSILDIAKKDGVDLTQFADIRQAMAYDKNSGELSAAELGSYMYARGMSLSSGTQGGEFFQKLSRNFNSPDPVLAEEPIVVLGSKSYQEQYDPAMKKAILDAETALAVKVGQHIFGDSRPQQSSVVTNTPQADHGLNNFAASLNNKVVEQYR
ncbi:MAG: hypothetical protein ACKVOE_08570 [Rickettsiales bacterium]